MPPPIEQESQRESLARAVRASSLRGIRFGAVLGGGIGLVVVLGALIAGIWSASRPGYMLRVPSVGMVAKLLGYFIAGMLIMAAYGAGIGAVLMSIWAVLRHRWRRTV